MRLTSKRKVNMPLRIAGVALILVLTSTCMISGMLARYTASGAAGDSAGVAAYCFDMKDGADSSVVTLSAQIRMPGDEAQYTFTLSNHAESGAVSEVAQQYTIRLRELSSLPLTYTLVMPDGQEKSLSADDADEGFVGRFAPSAKEDAEYTLKVVWPKDQNAFKYAQSGITHLEITVISEQID